MWSEVTTVSPCERYLLPFTHYQRSIEMVKAIVQHGIESMAPERAIPSVLESLDQCLFLNNARVLIPDADIGSQQLKILFAHKLSAEQQKIRYRFGEGFTGQVFVTGNSVSVINTKTSYHYVGKLKDPHCLPYAQPAFTAVPIIAEDGEIRGVLCANHGRRDEEETELTVRVLEEVAKTIAPLIYPRH
jgi:hypothetical protein